MRNKYKHFDWHSVGFNFGNWEEELIWALDMPVQKINIDELTWHLDIPYWKNDNGERWAISPRDVINKEVGSVKEQNRVHDVDISYPIDLYKHDGKLFVLDGLHRLVKQYVDGAKRIQVRIVPKDRFHEVASEHPFELPN